MTRPRRRLRIRFLPSLGQAVGLAVLVAALMAALVSAPLFTASAEAGAWERERERVGEVALGAVLRLTTASRRGEVVPERIRAVGDLDAGVEEAARSVGLGTPGLTAVFRNQLAGSLAGREELVEVASLPDVAGLEIVAGRASADGVLVPERLVDGPASGPGSTISLAGPNGTVVLPVSGVYVPPDGPSTGSWGGLRTLVPASAEWTGQPVLPPVVVLAPRQLALDTASALAEDLDLAWSFPLPESVGLSGARATAERFDALQEALLEADGPVAGVADADVGSALLRTPLPDAFASVRRTTGLLAPPVRAVGVGAAGAALVLVGAWTAHRARRRDDELRALVARGLSPLRAAGDGAREAVLPTLAGGLTGALLGWLLVRWLGPSPRLPSGAVGEAVAAALLGALAVLVVVAVVTALLVTRLYQPDSGHVAQLLGRVPWLAVVTAGTVVLVLPLVIGDRDEGGSLGVLPLLVPLLATVVVAGAVTALLPRVGRGTGARLRRLPPAPYLALRRVLAGRGAARLAVVTTALSLGLVVLAGALATSADRTLAARSAVATGSDVVVPLAQGQPVDQIPLWDESTVVLTGTGTAVGTQDTEVDLLVVRPEELTGVVRWDEALAERPLDELMGALAGYDGDRVPVVLAGSPVDGAPADGALVLDLGPVDLPVEVVARADAFPGQPGRRAMLVADLDRSTAALERAGSDLRLLTEQQLWSRGDAGAVVDLLPALGVVVPDPAAVGSSDAFAGRPELTAQGWSLGYLRAVALAAALLGLAGLAVHASVQQRRRTAAALLLTRMGMGHRSSDAAAGLEIGLLAGVAALVAVAVALPASALVLRLLDPAPGLRPDVLFRVPWSSIALVLAGAVLAAVGSALLVGRSARRTDGGQVLRGAP